MLVLVLFVLLMMLLLLLLLLLFWLKSFDSVVGVEDGIVVDVDGSVVHDSIVC